MKKNFIRFASIAMAAMASLMLMFSLNSCSDDDDDPSPEITWASNPSFETVPIADTMNVELTVTSPNAITGFVINVDSPDSTFENLLDLMVSEENKSANNNGVVVLNLISDAKTIAAFNLLNLGIPTGTEILNKTEVALSLSRLIPMIKSVASTEGNYVFETTVTDLNGESTTKDLIFHLDVS